MLFWCCSCNFWNWRKECSYTVRWQHGASPLRRAVWTPTSSLEDLKQQQQRKKEEELSDDFFQMLKFDNYRSEGTKYAQYLCSDAEYDNTFSSCTWSPRETVSVLDFSEYKKSFSWRKKLVKLKREMNHDLCRRRLQLCYRRPRIPTLRWTIFHRRRRSSGSPPSPGNWYKRKRCSHLAPLLRPLFQRRMCRTCRSASRWFTLPRLV